MVDRITPSYNKKTKIEIKKKFKDAMKNTIDYTYQDKDLFFGSKASIFEDTSKLDRTSSEYS